MRVRVVITTDFCSPPTSAAEVDGCLRDVSRTSSAAEVVWSSVSHVVGFSVRKLIDDTSSETFCMSLHFSLDALLQRTFSGVGNAR
jgi:hypothetical protein